MTRALRGCPRLLSTSAVLIAGITGGMLAGTLAAVSPVSAAASARLIVHRAAVAVQQADPVSATGAPGALAAVPGTLTGTVLGVTGRPLAGACVTATGQRGERTVPAGNGRYLIAGLPDGAYTVSFADCARPADYVRQWYGGSYTAAGAEHVEVLSGQTVRLGSVSLRPVNAELAIAAERHEPEHSGEAGKATATIAGTVFGPNGRRLPGICAIAWIRTQNGLTEEAVTTFRRGTYKLGLAITGRHVDTITMQFTAGCGSEANYAPQWWKYTAAEARAAALSVRAGTHLRGIDARLSAGGVIDGTVRADGAHGGPLAGICVEAIGGGLVGQVAVARSRANGSYRVTALGTGRYLLTFSTGCGNSGNYLSTAVQPVRVTAGKTTHVSVFLHPGGTISGTVTAAGTSPAAIRGICVMAALSGYPYAEARTATNGSYSMQQLPPGRYQVSFAGGCGNSGSYAPQYYPAQQSSAAATRIRIGYGQTTTGVDASMAPGATITGKVTSGAGHDLGGICPSLLTPQQVGAFGPGTYAIPGGAIYPTSASGTYRITNLAPGPYYVLFSVCLGTVNLAPVWYSGTPQFSTASIVSADGGAVTTGIDAVMRTGGTIAGTILGRGGRPVPGACPIAYDPAAPGLLSSAFGYLTGPDAEGRYRLTGLPSGSYRVQTVLCYGSNYASQWYAGKDSEGSATPVQVRARHVTAGIDVRLHAGGSVSGTVTSATGKRLPHVCVQLDNSRGEQVDVSYTSGRGRYVLAEEPPGTYTVTFAYCTSVSPPLAPATRSGVEIRTGRAVRGLNAVLRPGGSITGTVHGGGEGGSPPIPAAGVCIEATPKTGRGVATTAVTGPSGHYDLSGLAAGKYRLLFTDSCNGGAPLPLAPLTYPALVSAGPSVRPAAVNATLQADGQITGTVDRPGSAPLAGICVTAQPVAGGTPVVAVTTGTGSYSVDGLLPGSYRVKFSAGCGTTGDATQWFNDATSAGDATPVTVTPGEPTNGINADLTT